MATQATYPLMLDSTGQSIVTALNNLNTNISSHIEIEQELQKNLAKIQANNAGAHNSIYRGKDLTNVYTWTEICNMIRDNDLSDLYVGDYFRVSITGNINGKDFASATETIECQIAGFNCYLNCGDMQLTANHAVIVMRDCSAYTHQMMITDTGEYKSDDASNSTSGGYKGSGFYTTVLPKYVAALEARFGNRLLSRKALVTNAVNTNGTNAFGEASGCSTGWEWVTEKAGLMTEAELYGTPVVSSSMRDTGEACCQLPLFTLNPSARVASLGYNHRSGDVIVQSRQWYWLRGVANNRYFCDCSNYGGAIHGNASLRGGVRLRFLLGHFFYDPVE